MLANWARRQSVLSTLMALSKINLFKRFIMPTVILAGALPLRKLKHRYFSFFNLQFSGLSQFLLPLPFR
jgi:hypothetical protein